MPQSQLTQDQAVQTLNTVSNIASDTKQRFIADVLTTKPDVLYSPSDYATIRKQLFDNVQRAIAQRFPLRNQRYTLDVTDVGYVDPQHISIQQQKKAILQNKSIGRRIKGSWVLTDNATGKVVSKSGRQTLMTVPYMTDRGTFIRSGSQYTFNNIMRLQPGVYTKRNNDDLVSAQFNVKRGTGAGFNMKFIPSTGLFHINRGSRNVPAYFVLKQMGITDQQLKQAWGQELWQKNKLAGQTPRAASAAAALYNS